MKIVKAPGNYDDNTHQMINQKVAVALALQFLTLGSGKDQRRQWHPTPVLLPGKSHGWRSLVGCSPWDRKESDMTEQLHVSLSCIGEGNGNPLQYSWLENSMDGGAWQAIAHGVAKSQTRLSDFTLVFLPGKFHRGAWWATSMGSQRVLVLEHKQARFEYYSIWI